MSSDSSVQRINWRQAVAEVALIVAGVLIALAVDNWRENEEKRDAETQYLISLKQDFESNREELEASIKEQEGIIREGDAILKMIKAGLTDETAGEFFSRISNNLYYFRDSAPTTGTYDDMLNSGRLLYIENQRLRSELASFRRTLQHIAEYESIQIQTFYFRHSPFLSKNQDKNYSTWTDDYRPPQSPFTVDTSAFATLEYWNLVIEWIYVHADVIGNYRRGVEHCDRIIQLIDSELAKKDK